MITTILVPQGAEYQAVKAGFKRVIAKNPSKKPNCEIVAIPMGMQPLEKYLQQKYLQQKTHHPENRVLMMGLCGSLKPNYQLGDVVLYQSCLFNGKIAECDQIFTADIHNCLGDHVSLVKGLTSDRVISTHQEKHLLSQQYQTEVVDMEGFTALQFFLPLKISVAMLRVISDDANHDIPNLESVINGDGSLQILPLIWQLIHQPLAAIHLIKGSLTGLKTLTQITEKLLTENPRSF